MLGIPSGLGIRLLPRSAKPAGKYPRAFERQLTPDFLCDTAVKWPVFPMTCHQHLCRVPVARRLRYLAN